MVFEQPLAADELAVEAELSQVEALRLGLLTVMLLLGWEGTVVINIQKSVIWEVFLGSLLLMWRLILPWADHPVPRLMAEVDLRVPLEKLWNLMVYDQTAVSDNERLLGLHLVTIPSRSSLRMKKVLPSLDPSQMGWAS